MKRYIHEDHSEEVLRRCAKASKIQLSALCVPELISGFQRLKREGKITDDVYLLLKEDFAEDIEEALVAEAARDVMKDAVRCVEKAGIKASDAIHIATALRLGSDLFMTADRAQGEAARTMGLKCEVVGK